MQFDILNEDNFMMFATQAHRGISGILSEFEEDLRHIKYTKRLLGKYRHSGDLKERLILNHLIVLYNQFDPESVTRMLFMKIHPEDYAALKTFLMYINYMPTIVKGIFGNNIMSSDISIDLEVVKRLQGI